MGLVPQVNGRVEGRALLDGRDLVSMPEADMRRLRGNEIAMIFQEPMTSLNPVLSVGFQIAEALRYHRGLDRQGALVEARRMLDLVRIPDAQRRLTDYPHQFSGGMRQRVMIAMALACRPKVLIADEPTTALDVTVQAEILELMKDLQRERGMAILFITHDMGVVAEVADRVLVMWRGNKVEEAPATTLFASPRANYTRSLVGAVPRLGSMRGEAGPRKLRVIDPVDGRMSRARRGAEAAGRGGEAAAGRGPDDQVSDHRRRARAGEGARACRRERVVRAGARRDFGAGRRVGLRQIHHRALDPAPRRAERRHGAVRGERGARRCRRAL